MDPVLLQPGQHLVFIGDSITDCGRRDDPEGLGQGYVRKIAASLGSGFRVTNRGISGDRVRDLEARWTADVLDLQPDVLTLFVGINDVWRVFDSGAAFDLDSVTEGYRRLVESVSCPVVLIEPFVLPVPPDRLIWRPVLDPLIAFVRGFESSCRVVRLDALMNGAAGDAPALLAHDGVHPTDAGHELIKDAWLGLVQP
ncbi:MAG: SGNH/GDSL hydrolase family protein [Armatimonadetes bacterium]|nr:SGNH/GDSL hydrolase family protein [Armatimonadota bacterium]